MKPIPLTEFDDDPQAIIEPSILKINPDVPEYCVMPIYGDLLDKIKSEGRLEKVDEIDTSFVPIEVFKTEFEGKYIAIAHPGIGAPFVAAILEGLIALGCRKFVACGSGGVLKSELNRGSVVIPDSAVRDEGTSYHYIPPSREIAADKNVVWRLEAVLQKHHIDYTIGKTWTTDGLFRETKGKVSRRKAEGCLMVEMECSALMAVAKFRNVAFGQYLVAGDDVSGDEWDPRYVDDKMPVKEKIFWLSVEACLTL